MAAKPLPSQETLRQLLDYDPETGVLRWKVRPRSMFGCDRIFNSWNARYAGATVGVPSTTTGYIQLRMLGETHRAHRLIWRMMTGKIADEVDHIDGDRTNNRWANLRDVDRSTNQRNAKRRSDNKSGVTGVHLETRSSKWCARIAGRVIGHFTDFNDAVAARKSAEIAAKFHPNHGAPR